MRDEELIRVDDLVVSLCREMGYTGAEFGLEVVSAQNAVLSRAKLGGFTLYRTSKPYPFAVDGLEEVHGALRLSAIDASKVREQFLAKSGDIHPREALPDIQSGSVPVGKDPFATAVPMLKQRAQENRILELLISGSYDPLRLPARPPGKRGAKSETRNLALLEPALFTTGTFNTAWQRLREDGRLAGSE